MMSLKSKKQKGLTCQLCFNICADRHRDLYDKNGQKTEIHMVTAKYFNPAWLVNEHNVNVGVICVECWHNIYEFDLFQESIVRKHMRFDLLQRNPQPSRNTNGIISYGVPCTSIPMHMVNLNDFRRLGVNSSLANSLNLSNESIERQNDGEPIEIDSNVADQSSLEVQTMQDENLSFIPNDKVEIDETSLNLPYEGNEPQGDHPIQIENNSMMPQNNEQIVNISNPLLPPNAIQSSVTQTPHLGGMVLMQNDINICSDLSSGENAFDSSAESEDFDESVGIFIGGEFNKPVEQTQIENHIHYHSDHLGAYKCEICFKCYSKTHELKEHLKIKHAGLRYVCSKCGKGFMAKQAMSIHMKLPCNKDENEKNLLRTHTCKDCGKSYKTKSILRIHYKNVHMAERKIYTCPICDKPTTSLSVFHAHKLVHTVVKDRKFSCEFCSGKYLQRKIQLLHLKKAHPKEWNERQEARIANRESIKTYKCQSCEKVYKTQLALNEHKKVVHSGEVNFKCKLCPKTYRYSSNVAAHFKRVHFEEWENKQKSEKNL